MRIFITVLKKSKFLFVTACFIFFTVQFLPVKAAITETQALSFGIFALRNNNAQYDLTIQPDGAVVAAPEFAIISNGQPASFDVSAFPANTTLIITVTANDLTVGGSGTGEAFTPLNFQYLPNPTITDAAGNASFTLGATLRTSGTSNVYPDSNYSGSAIVSVNF